MKKGNQGALVAIAALGIFIAPFLFIFRGIDVTDTGFVLTNQRFVFSSPESVSYWFHLWLTNVAGGLVDLAFGQRYGLIAHRIASAAIFWLTASLVFALYRKALDKRVVILGILFGCTFSFADKVNVVHYNNLSALLFFASSLSLYRALFSGKRALYALSGFIAALNVFARFPNLPGVGIILIPFAYNLLFGKTRKKIGIGLSDFLSFAAGCALALLCAFGTMKCLGHFDLYLKSLGELSNIGSVGQSKYSAYLVLLRPVRDTVFSLALGSLVFFLLWISCRARFSVPRFIRYPIYLLCALCAYGFLAPALLASDQDRIYLWTTAGIGYVAVLYLFATKEPVEILFAALLAAVNILLLDLGSDTAIRVSMFAFISVFPAFFHIVRKMSSGDPARAVSAIAGIILSLYLGFGAYTVQYSVYRDKDTVSMSEQAQLAGIYTSPRRAQVIDDMTRAIEDITDEGDLVYIHDSAPLLHYLTRTRPYARNPWPVIYSPDYLARMLDAAREESGDVPFVLVKQNPRSPNWPDSNVEPYQTDVVFAFMSKNGYTVYKETADFAIYARGEMGGGK